MAVNSKASGFSWADEVEKEAAVNSKASGFSWADEVEKEAAVNSKTSVFSWADEVEKEEAEAQAQVQGPQKSNPFGSARPREIVLQEKGINWRKLDEQIQASNIRKEKQPAATQSVNKQKRYLSKSGNLVPNSAQIQHAGDTGHQLTRPTVCIKQQKQNIHSPLVPPLRYPPKNMLTLMENGSQRFCVFELASERDNANYQNIGGYFSGPGSKQQSRHNQHMERYFAVENHTCQSMQPSNADGMQAWEEKENMNSECRRELVGNMLSSSPEQLLMNRGAVTDVEMERSGCRVEKMQNASNGHVLENSNRQLGRKGEYKLKMDQPKRRAQPNSRMSRAGFHGSVDEVSTNAMKNSNENNFDGGYVRSGPLNMKKADSVGNYKDRAGRFAVEEASSMNIEVVNGRKNYHAQIEQFSVGERIPRSSNTESRNFEGNDKKRGIASAAGISNFQQRRRR